jgi:endonuclease-3
MEDLLTLPGVGRKIANLILGDIYGKPAIVADTHCIRISNRLGLANSKTPEKVEKALVEIVDPEKQSDFCHRLVWFGREVCDARKPDCENCMFRHYKCLENEEK